MIAADRHHPGQSTGRRHFLKLLVSGAFGSSAPRCPLCHDTQRAAKASRLQTAPQFRPVAATAVPLGFQIRKIAIQRAFPDAEHISPQAPDNLADEPTAVAEATGDFLDRNAVAVESAPNLVALRTKDRVATIADLVRSSLRLRPDRICVGEVRGSEALDLLKAWGTGHPGGVGTIHAGTAIGALRRLEQLIQEVVITVPRALIAETVDVIAVLSGRGSARRLSELAFVEGLGTNGDYRLVPASVLDGLSGAPDRQTSFALQTSGDQT